MNSDVNEEPADEPGREVTASRASGFNAEEIGRFLRLDLPPLVASPLILGERSEQKSVLQRPRVKTLLPAGDRLLVKAGDAARFCGMSRTTWFKLKNAGRVPDPIRHGRVIHWHLDELRQWIDAGCPAAHKWRALKEQQSRRDKR